MKKIKLYYGRTNTENPFKFKNRIYPFLGVPLIIVLLGECDHEWVGLYADNFRASYLLETIGILLAATCVLGIKIIFMGSD